MLSKDIEVIEKLRPKTFKKLTIEEKKKLVNDLEEVVANFQGRNKLDIILFVDNEVLGEYNTADDKIYIGDQAMKNPYILINVLLHEGYHHMQLNIENYSDKFSEEKKEIFSLNSYLSEIDSTLLNYSFHDINSTNYYTQPVEYFAYEEALERGIEFFEIVQEMLNEKNMVKKYINQNRFWTRIASKIGKENIETVLHPDMLEKYKIQIKEDKEANVIIRKKVETVLGVQNYLEDISPEELGYFFMPLCWDELSLEKRKEVYNKFIEKNELENPNKDLINLEASGLEVLDSIYLNHTNGILKNATGKDVDFLKEFNDKSLNSYLIWRLNPRKQYKKHRDKDIDSFYPYEDLKDAFFLFPKFNLVIENYYQDQLTVLDNIEAYFTHGTKRKHSELDDNIAFLEITLWTLSDLMYDQIKFQKQFENKTRK